MARQNRAARDGGARTNLYDEITAKIINELEQGRLPWVQPWGTAAKAPLAMPRNAATARQYSGINILILWGAVVQYGYPTQHWLTFRQALSLGGNVRKGERGTTVVYADRFTPEDEKRRARETGEEAGSIPFLKRFTVFNTAQCEGLPEDVAVEAPPPPPHTIEPRVETLIRATGIDFRIGGSQAFYVPAHDYVQVPPPQAYFEPIDWHRTALHELGHATGHASRLGRDMSGRFGTRKYAFEELVAEMNAAFCCASIGVVPTVRHADYIGSWLEVLREDNRAIVRAAFRRAKEQVSSLRRLVVRAGVDIIAAEISTTTPYTYPTFSFGVMIGIMASLDRPVVEVLPYEVKLAVTGNDKATKRDVIAWAMGLPAGPQVRWPTSGRPNKLQLKYEGRFVTKGAEHPADALAVIQAAVQTEQFRLARSLRF